MFVYA